MGVAPNQFDNLFFERNPSFTATSHVIELTRPLTALGLGYFTFDRHYHDGSRISLTNHAQWIKHYWQSGLFASAIFEQVPLHFTNGHVFWSWLNREPIYSSAALHGIDHGVTLTKNHKHYCDFFHFGATNNAKITNENIVGNIAHLHRFASIFEYRARMLIEKAEKDRIFPSVRDNKMQAPDASDLNEDAFYESLFGWLGKREIARIYLGEEFKHCHLTMAETTLLRELISGVSCFKIAKKLNITDDAVNKHIKSIKGKLGSKTLCEIGFVAGRLSANTILPVLVDKCVTPPHLGAASD